jgi:hypothetical protein
MADWASVGHGMRRRSGKPMNHHEAAGESMTRKHYTSDEVHEMAQNAGSARIPMGMDASDTSAPCGMCGSSPCVCSSGQTDELNAGEFAGTLMPRHNTQAMDPSNPGSKQNRVNIERIGATYRVEASTMGLMDPTLGPTQQHGRIVPSVMGRNTPNFYSGEQDSYI